MAAADLVIPMTVTERLVIEIPWLFGFEKLNPRGWETPGARGEAALPEMVKALPLLSTCSWTFAYPYWVLPEASWPEPTMLSVFVPAAALGDAVTWSVDVLPVAGLGEKVAVTPVGRPTTLREIGPSRLVRESVRLYTPLEPGAMLTVLGLLESEMDPESG